MQHCILVHRTSNGVISSDELLLTYKSIHQDVRAAVDWVHMKVSLQQCCRYSVTRAPESECIQNRRAVDPSKKLTNSCQLTQRVLAWEVASGMHHANTSNCNDELNSLTSVTNSLFSD